jgi:hypothetical protein
MRITRCKLKTIVKGTGVYHEKRWNVKKSTRFPEKGLTAMEGCVNW